MATEGILRFQGVRTGPPVGHGLWFGSLGKVTISLYFQTRDLLNSLFPLEISWRTLVDRGGRKPGKAGRRHARRRDPYKTGAAMTAVVHGRDAHATI